MGIRSVAVIGLGLIGGSLARDLAARGVRVLGYDRDPLHLQSALAAGILRKGLDDSLEGLAEAEIVVLAVPVSAAPDVLRRAEPWLDRARLVTDVGSTKQSTVAAAERLGIGNRFVGSHPLAGDHRSGWAASRTGLFSGARIFLCPAPSAHEEAVVLARDFWRSVGAIPEPLDADTHDRRLAWTSHLPQAVSTTLALVLADAGIERSQLGAAGREMTRVAGSSPEMWTAIALDNAAVLADAVAAVESRLRAFRRALGSSDAAGVHECFAGGQQWAARDRAD